VVFYACMLVLVLWRDVLPPAVEWVLVGLVGLCMLLAFVGYLQVFIRIYRAEKAAVDPETDPAQVPEKG
jgi:heme A synthase